MLVVNTGWSGGPVGEGERMPIKATRALLSAALDGTLNSAEMRTDEFFGFEVPLSVEGIDKTILVPRNTWSNKDGYDSQASKLVKMFSKNFSIFEEHVDQDVINAAPSINGLIYFFSEPDPNFFQKLPRLLTLLIAQ